MSEAAERAISLKSSMFDYWCKSDMVNYERVQKLYEEAKLEASKQDFHGVQREL